MATRLLQLLGGETVTKDAVISGLTVDSRAVSEGDLFVALPGTVVDGRTFIDDAIARGASAILTTKDSQKYYGGGAVPVVEDSNPRQRYAQIAARFCGEQPAVQVAVTGTNGKTSVADFTRQLWHRLQAPAASLGTLGVRSALLNVDGGLTTPDPMALHQALHSLKLGGVNHVAVEASSHGLDQYRLDGMQVRAAAFTNLTRDHLDYHKTEQAYFYAKARLFGELLAPDATAVINIDDPWGAILDDIAWGRSLTRLTFGRQPGASIRLAGLETTATGQALKIEYDECMFEAKLPLVGDFQAMNALAAAGLVIATGFDARVVFDAFELLEGVPGRMEFIGVKNGAGVFVDYAHTPDGLKTVLLAARAHGPRKLHVVFGCGGDRDAGKRPQMGAVAQEFADAVYITDDNPRTETPAAIRQQIMAACPDAREFDDRAKAIEAALGQAGTGDMVIIAGKGHETGQTFADKTIEYSDIATVRALIGPGVSVHSDRAGD